MLKKLQARFEDYINRHKGLDWAIYHNGAQSYYGSRGFRGSLKV